MAQLSKKMESLNIDDKKKKNVRRMRKRLSVSDATGQSPLLLDGYHKDPKSTEDPQSDGDADADNDNADDNDSFAQSPSQLFKAFSSKSKVGVVPFNPNKVNQDRAIIVPELANAAKGSGGAALFGVFDGHGMIGHDVSSYLLAKMPQWFAQPRNKGWAKDPSAALTQCFAWLTKALQKSDVNCTFSGSTAVVTLIDAEKLYTANVGDSRAVLAREEQGKLKAIGLSFDQKPDNVKEKERIEKKNGRVEPCKGPMGEFIGPHRVWLKNQDMPGLAMSRSFGDDVAASVGVISEPEVTVRARSKSDKFYVAASDGVFEFLSNDDVVEIVSKYKDAKRAAKALCKEATRKWQTEEDVIDDITAVVVFF